MILAVDFDGTLAVTDYPTILSPKRDVIDYCKWQRSLGHTLILNTCREGKALEDAIEWCKQYCLEFDYVNENVPERVAKYGDCRKIYADKYLDDHNVLISEIPDYFYYV